MAGLTAKQKIFCDEYLIDLNATRAAIAAGYSEKTAYSVGSENLKKPELQKYMQKRLKEREDNLIASQDEVLKYLTSVMRREQKENVVITTTTETIEDYALDEDTGKTIKKRVTKEIPQIIEIPAKLSDANKAAELLGKRYSLFTDNVKMDGTVQVVIAGADEIAD